MYPSFALHFNLRRYTMGSDTSHTSPFGGGGVGGMSGSGGSFGAESEEGADEEDFVEEVHTLVEAATVSGIAVVGPGRYCPPRRQAHFDACLIGRFRYIASCAER
jgi:hypothetical protein